MAKRVVITGIGPISSLGNGSNEVWDSITKLHTNIVKHPYLIDNKKWAEFYLHKMANFDINDFDIPRHNFKYVKEMRTVIKEDTDLYYFLATISLALKDSGLQYDVSDNNIGLILTHENPGVEIFFEELVDMIGGMIDNGDIKAFTKLDMAKALYESGCDERGYNLQTFSYLFSVAKVFDVHGYSLFINNACASGLYAIEAAAQQIKIGACPAVIVSGVDNPNKIFKYLWFRKRGLYSETGLSSPFSTKSDGIVFGDGGSALILEELEHAKKRGACIYAEYLGGGFSLEGWKIVVPDVTGNHYTSSFKKAVLNARVNAEDISFINPHGVGMKITDTYEARTINHMFRNIRPYVSAFKPLVGHNLGGSALLESSILMLSMKHHVIPPTLNSDHIDDELQLNVVKEFTKSNLDVTAKMSCGFAGFNGVSIFRQYS